MRFSRIAMRRIAVPVLVMLCAPALLLASIEQPAFAHASTSTAPTAAVVSMPLTLDCASVPNTVQAQAFVRSRGLCSTKSATGPYMSVTGNCGTLSLYTTNSGGGYMGWHASISSSLGNMVYAQYNGSWQNTNTGYTGGVSRNSGAIFESYWFDAFPILTGPGFVASQIYQASDVLWWGATCTNNGVAVDTVDVTR